MVDSKKKAKIISDLGAHKNDTGSAQTQVGILTERIKQLSSHLDTHKKDRHSRRGLLQMVGKRRKLLDYLKTNDEGTYNKLIKSLKLRR